MLDDNFEKNFYYLLKNGECFLKKDNKYIR